MNETPRRQVVAAFNEALEHELGSIVRYLHDSFVVYGPNRDPIVQHFRAKARESLEHAVLLGEKIAALGGVPTAKVDLDLEPKRRTVEQMLKSDLENEKEAIAKYHRHLELVKDDVALDFFVRRIIIEEQQHVDDLSKLLRKK